MKNISAFAVTLTLGATQVATANLNFNLVPFGTVPDYARDGFAAAANMWSAAITDDVTVNLIIGFSSLGPGIIGETSSGFVEFPYSTVTAALASHRTSPDDFSSFAALQPGSSYQRLINHTSDSPYGANSATPYLDTMDRVGMTTVNAKALSLPPGSSPNDGLVRFSSDFSFDFDRSNGIQPNQIDFVGVAAHEIGHVLGFVSGVDDIDYLGGAYAAGDFSSNMLDLYRFSDLSLAAGSGFQDYTADQRQKYFSTDGGLTQIAPFSTGVNYGDGRQASHWRDFLGLGLLDPTASYGELLKLSATDLRAFDVMGYTVAPEPGLSASVLTCAAVAIYVRLRLRRNPSSSQVRSK